MVTLPAARRPRSIALPKQRAIPVVLLLWASFFLFAEPVRAEDPSSGVELLGRTAEEGPPRRWSLHDVESRKLAASVRNRWGIAALPAGRYQLKVQPRDGKRFTYGEIEVLAGEVTQIVLDTALEIAVPQADMEPPAWAVFAAGGSRKAIVRPSAWGPQFLAPGTYDVELAGVRKSVVLESGKVTKLQLGDFGLGYLDIELPAATGLRIAGGSQKLQLKITPSEKGKNISWNAPDGVAAQGFSSWVRSGSATLRITSGQLRIEREIQVPAGGRLDLPFEPAELAERHGLSVFSVSIQDAAGKEVQRGTQLVFMDKSGERLLAVAENPSSEVTWLTPGQPRVRASLGAQMQTLDLPSSGVLGQVAVPFTPEGAKETPSGIKVDIVIQSPAEDAIIAGDEVALTGRASTTGIAGATRLAVVIDTSGSTKGPSGADLDGDGDPESILEAEIAAADRLLDALQKVEASGPGIAFEVAILRFQNRAEVMGPLTPMTDAKGVEALRAGLQTMRDEGHSGGTRYHRGLDLAVETLDLANHRGDSVILFLSDGAPDGLIDGLSAAARTGLHGTVIHTFGLGRSFRDEIAPEVGFPPAPRGGANILATVAALGGPGGSVTALPRPADIVEVVPKLPLLELPEAELKEVLVVNETIGKPAASVALSPDGSFEAEVPVSFFTDAAQGTNTLTATAIAIDGVTTATDQVVVGGKQTEPGWLAVESEGEAIAGIAAPNIELIFDASGSMRETTRKVDGRLKIDVARDVMAGIVDEMPEKISVGLRIYGHRIEEGKTGDCQDSELSVPLGPMDKAGIKKIVRTVPVIGGTTPLAYSLVQAARDLAGRPGDKLIVLVTDGKEECGGRPQDVAEALVEQGLNVRVEVVGFALADEAVKQEMERIAEVTGGRFFDARDSAGLKDSLRAALAVPYSVLDETGARVGQGVVGRGAVTLPAGRYSLVVHAVDTPIEIADVSVASKEVTRLKLAKSGKDISHRLDGPAKPEQTEWAAALAAGTPAEAAPPRRDIVAKPEDPDQLARLTEVLDRLETELEAATPERVPRPSPEPRIREAQRQLAELGFDPGAADGLWGRKTADALQAFQGWYPGGGLEQNAELDAPTQEALDDALSKGMEYDGGSRPDPELAAAESTPLVGPAEVLDSGTLVVAGEIVRLQGVRGEGGESAEGLAQYLRGRAVSCRLKGGDFYRCRLGGYDISEVVLFNGGARATPDAPPELRAAEADAKSKRLGVWR